MRLGLFRSAPTESGQTMTHLICSIHESSAAELRRIVEGLPPDSHLWLELRLDGLPEDAVACAREISAASDRPTIATCRSVGQGGLSALTAIESRELLGSFASDYCDLEFSPGHPAAEWPTGELDAKRNMLSYHDFHSIPQNLAGLLDEMERSAREHDVAKVAWACADISENLLALELLAERPGKRVLICMGERGLMSRVLAAKVGAFGTFCAAAEGRAAAPGQLSVQTMLNLYRWPKISSKTKFFGVIGSPVGHSLSPRIFNTQFSAHDYDGVYLPLLIDSEEELIGFLNGCREKRWLDATGFSVTIPHKESVCRWLGDRADQSARRIGAVNTLHLVDGDYRGFNTDYLGILEALRSGAGLDATALGSKQAMVLGAGGAARAAVAALVDSGCDVTVFNRTADRAAALARDFGCKSGSWDDRANAQPDLIVNCTSVGMWPKVDASPMPAAALRAKTVVFDTVYKPRETALLRDAHAAGCLTISGIEMFIHQAAAQYRIWTELDADLSLLRATVERALEADAQDAVDEQ